MNIDTLKERCTDLLVKGQKIQAIKLWREHTGASLKEAKKSIELFESTGAWPLVANGMVTTNTSTTPSLSRTDNITKECTSFINNGNKIGAIKLWREHTGASLNEAKEAIEQLEAARTSAVSTAPAPSLSHGEPEEASMEEEERPPQHQQGLGAGYWLFLLGLCAYLAYSLLA